MNRRHLERDADTFPADAYTVRGHTGVAWYVLGWETAPTEDTEWGGLEERTGRVVAIMVGDDQRWTFKPEDLTPLDREAYCGSCGQIGCAQDGYDRSADEASDRHPLMDEWGSAAGFSASEKVQVFP